MMLQNFILNNLSCLYRVDLKRTVFTILQYIYKPINTKNILTGSSKKDDKNLFRIIKHPPLVIRRCYLFNGGYFKQTSFLQCALNYDIIAKIDKYE